MTDPGMYVRKNGVLVPASIVPGPRGIQGIQGIQGEKGDPAGYTIRETITTPVGATAKIRLGAPPVQANTVYLWIDKVLAIPGVDYTQSVTGGITELAMVTSIGSSKKVHLSYVAASATPPASTLVADTSYLGTVMADSPWGIWTQTEASGAVLADSSGGARGLTITGTPTAMAVAGPKPQIKAIDWPANTGVYAKTSVGPAGYSTAVGQSFECWVYLTANPSGQLTLMQVGDVATGSGNNNFALYVNTNGTVGGYYWNGTITFSTTNVLPLNQWNHIVYGSNSTQQKIRVNKSAWYTGSRTDFIGYGNAIWVHGGWNNTAQVARIAGPAFYNSLLSDASIDAHYDAP